MRLRKIMEGLLALLLVVTSCLSARCEVLCAMPHGSPAHRHAALMEKQQAPSDMAGMSDMEECHHASATSSDSQSSVSSGHQLTPACSNCVASATHPVAELRETKSHLTLPLLTAVVWNAILTLPSSHDVWKPVPVPSPPLRGMTPFERSSSLRV